MMEVTKISRENSRLFASTTEPLAFLFTCALRLLGKSTTYVRDIRRSLPNYSVEYEQEYKGSAAPRFLF